MEPLAEIYFPYTQVGAEGMLFDVTLVIRTAVAPASVTADVRRAVRSVDPACRSSG